MNFDFKFNFGSYLYNTFTTLNTYIIDSFSNNLTDASGNKLIV